jgi:hypothetical protein
VPAATSGRRLLAALALCAGLCAARPAPAAMRFDPARMIAADEIRPGMTGTALTVFQGDSIESFGVRVLSVIRNTSSDGDLILVQLLGERLEHTGVAAGMIGSPVYLDGRLAGAIALGWPFSKDAVAGVTPIAQMIRCTEVPDSARRRELDPRSQAAGARMSPAPLLYGIRGRSAGTAALAESLFAGLGFLPVDVGGAARGAPGARAGTDPLRPGAAVGVALVSGDLDLSAVGTVTWRDGDQLLAFGHPLFAAGSVSLPLTTAYIHTILSSQLSSTKMASPGESVGALTEDRNYAVRGRLGGRADQIPLSLDVTGEDGELHRYRYRVMRHHGFTAVLAAISVSDGIGTQTGGLPRLALPYGATVFLDGGRTVSWQDQPASFGGGQPAGEPARELAARLNLLLNNSWSEARVESIQVSATVHPGAFGATLETAWLLQGAAHPGDRVRIAARIRPERGETRVEPLELQLPGFLPAGRYRLVVGDIDARLTAERERAPGVFRPGSLEQALQLLDLKGTRASLYVALYSDDTGASTRGQELPALPGSALAAMQDGRLTAGLQWVRARRWAEAVQPMPWSLSGSVELVLNVEREER